MCFPILRTAAMRLCSRTAAISSAGDLRGSGFWPSQTDSITSPVMRWARPRAMVSTSGSSGMFFSVQKRFAPRQLFKDRCRGAGLLCGSQEWCSVDLWRRAEAQGWPVCAAEDRCASDVAREGLVFQRHYCAAVLAKCGNSLQITGGVRHDHNRAVAVDGMTAGGKIPLSALRMLRRNVAGRLEQRRCPLREWATLQQEEGQPLHYFLPSTSPPIK